MKRDKLKGPNDYPLFGYRVKPDVKKRLSKSLEEVLKLYNSKLSKDQKRFKKNEIFEEALVKGLKQMKRGK